MVAGLYWKYCCNLYIVDKTAFMYIACSIMLVPTSHDTARAFSSHHLWSPSPTFSYSTDCLLPISHDVQTSQPLVFTVLWCKEHLPLSKNQLNLFPMSTIVQCFHVNHCTVYKVWGHMTTSHQFPNPWPTLSLHHCGSFTLIIPYFPPACFPNVFILWIKKWLFPQLMTGFLSDIRPQPKRDIRTTCLPLPLFPLSVLVLLQFHSYQMPDPQAHWSGCIVGSWSLIPLTHFFTEWEIQMFV